MAEDFKSFRAELLRGAVVGGRDDPATRAAAAVDYFERGAQAARDGVVGAQVAVEKAEDALTAARESLVQMQAAGQSADRELEWARRIVDELASAGTSVHAGVAGAEGGA